MNLLDYEIFDQLTNNYEASLHQVDKFYPNEKSLAAYFLAMSEKPLEEFKRFTPIKGEGEREALRNLSHFGAALYSMVIKIYNDAQETEKAAIELLAENKKLKDTIHDLKASEKFYYQAYFQEYFDAKEMHQMHMDSIKNKRVLV